ncbi:MAG: FAD-binding protein [Chloroflexota bacterium]
MRIETVEADVLCIGGGIVGLMAAIRASELGARVVVADKSNTLRSGAAGVGNDHFQCYIPEVHGDVDTALGASRRSKDDPRARVLFTRSFELVELWNSWGIPMKYKGKWEFSGHRLPDSVYGVHLKYAGLMQKPILTKQALKRAVKIINRVMVFDLLGDSNGVTGALGVDTRDDRLVEFRAKAVILGTGILKRLYPGPTPGWMANLNRPLTNSGDGRAMAYRLGAELANMETLGHSPGPKYFSRSGKATWVGVVRYTDGRPVGPYLTKPDHRFSDVTLETGRDTLAELERTGKGPFYMDCRGISPEDYEYMMYWLVHEGNASVIDHMKEEGIDPRKNPVEFFEFGPDCTGMVNTNVKTETSVKGLYAAGDEIGGGISGAAVFGWIAGENSADYIKKAKPSSISKTSKVIGDKEKFLEGIRSREEGPGWQEVNIALQQTMRDYAGLLRTENLLVAGLAHLRRIKDKAHNTMIARNPHELMRGLETLNLLDLAELIFIAAMERKETRGMHIRADYPFTNPMLDKLLVVKKKNGKPVTEWRGRGK